MGFVEIMRNRNPKRLCVGLESENAEYLRVAHLAS